MLYIWKTFIDYSLNNFVWEESVLYTKYNQVNLICIATDNQLYTLNQHVKSALLVFEKYMSYNSHISCNKGHDNANQIGGCGRDPKENSNLIYPLPQQLRPLKGLDLLLVSNHGGKFIFQTCLYQPWVWASGLMIIIWLYRSAKE